MDEEFFYGATLDKEGATVTWDFTNEEEQGPTYKLLIKQVLLGHTAKQDEFNVVEVETMSTNEHLKIPIAVLKVGETRYAMTNFEFTDAPVVFKLVQGSGPVYIHGNQVPVYLNEQEPDMENEEAEDEQEVVLEEEDEGPAIKKKKVSENGSKVTQNGNGNKASNPKSNKRPYKA